jgi:hypothetical protein
MYAIRHISVRRVEPSEMTCFIIVANSGLSSLSFQNIDRMTRNSPENRWM